MTPASAHNGPIVLVGLMGSGKSTVASVLATTLGRTPIDLDEAIVNRTGTSINDIFATSGEAAFRQLEHDVLTEALSHDDGAVIASGGGVVVREDNRALLKSRATTVWLRLAPEVAARRVGNGDGRPLLSGDPRAALISLSAQRAPLYQEVADIVIDVDRLRAPAVAKAICEELGLAS